MGFAKKGDIVTINDGISTKRYKVVDEIYEGLIIEPEKGGKRQKIPLHGVSVVKEIQK